MRKNVRLALAGVVGLALIGGTLAAALPATAATTAAGCANGRTTIPKGASTRRIGDVDGDGRADTEFLTAKRPYQYGIRTAAGGVYTIPDVLAGPGRHRAWQVASDGQGQAIVIDDGVNATLQEFRDCKIVRKLNRDGQPFLLGLAGSGGPNTGVACNDLNGGILVLASRAVRRSNGHYDVVWTPVQPVQGAKGGTTVMLDPSESFTRWRDLPAGSTRVKQAGTSHCWAAPNVVQITR
jgi:hypothetical protein